MLASNEGSNQPAPDRKAPFWMLVLLGCYGALLAALTVLNRSGADRWWLGAFNLYLPQVIWLIPGLILALLCLRVARRWTLVALLCVAWVLGPIMGISWRMPEGPKSVSATPLRIMTWNAKYTWFGKRDKVAMAALLHEIDWNQLDLVVLQDASDSLSGPLGNYFRTWNVQTQGQFVIASRLPLLKSDNPLVFSPTKKNFALRCRLQVGPSVVTIYNVHFDSPREALGSMLQTRKDPWFLPNAIRQIELNTWNRLTQARLLRESLSQESGPVIVAGDFNSPDSSSVCINLRKAGLHDSFAEGGRGYGYTYGHFLHNIGNSWMRLDHIMMSPQLSTRRSWTGTWKASEHRPVIADLLLSP
jgi:vancomycin resistance protein VanJ